MKIEFPTDRAGGEAVRNPALDGLRGLAAVTVILGHAVLEVGGLDLWASSVRNFPSMTNTQIAMRIVSALLPADAMVMVFFVLSGHVLWGSFRRRRQGFLDGLPDYVSARVYRLFPMAIMSAVPLGLFAAATAQELVMNMLLLRRNLNGVLWTLQVEVVASFALFALWGLTKGDGRRLLVALVLAFGAVHFSRGDPYVVFFPAFILGASLSLVPGSVWRRGWILWPAIVVLVGTSTLLGHAGITRVFEMAGASVLVGAVSDGKFAWLRSTPMLFVGSISYPLYLMQWLGLDWANALLPGMTLTSPFVHIAALGVLAVLITLPVAWLLHVTVEDPVLRARPRLNWPDWVRLRLRRVDAPQPLVRTR